jgi:hypothetical protein
MKPMSMDSMELPLGFFAGEVEHAAVGNPDGVTAVAEFDAFDGVGDIRHDACLCLERLHVDFPRTMAAVCALIE